MGAAEATALACGRTLLMPEGALCSTTVYYRNLAGM